MILKRTLTAVLTSMMLTGAMVLPNQSAFADHGRHLGWYKGHRAYYDDRRHSIVDYKTGKILKGGLIGAGIGAASGFVFDRPIARSAVLGAGIGAGVQAVRYSSTMRRHPIARTAAYGAMAGAGVNALRRDASPLKGALWGTAIGAGVGVLKDMR